MILVTGGLGFIGLHTARELLDGDADLVLTRYRVRREPAFLSEELDRRVVVETVDVANTHGICEIMHRHDIESVVHLAVPALGALVAAEEARVNMTGLLNILEAARIHGVRRVTVASSITVYAGVDPGPWREDALLPLASSNATGAFKKVTEILADHYAERTGLDVALLRIGHVYGPLYHSMYNLPSRLAHASVGRITAPGAEGAPLYEDDGLDYCYVKDCARGIRHVHLAGELSHRVFNVGGGRVTTNRELVEAVRRVYPDFRPPILPGTSRETVPSERYMDLTRVQGEVGYWPRYSVDEAIGEYLAWLGSHDE